MRRDKLGGSVHNMLFMRMIPLAVDLQKALASHASITALAGKGCLTMKGAAEKE